MRGKPKEEALIGIGKLEALARGYASTSKGLLKLAKGLRRLTEELRQPQASPEPQRRIKGQRKAKGKASVAQPQKRRMGAAAKKKLSQAMKLRWLERKAQAAAALPKANGQHKKPVPEGNAA